MNLTPHFTLEELIASEVAERHGIDNTPPDTIMPVLHELAVELEKVRAVLGVPMHINSGFRSRRTNDLVGGREFSQHMRGEAADFIAPRLGSPLMVCRAIVASNIVFDQLIYEFSWVHISFTTRRPPRRSMLTIRGRDTRPGIVSTPIKPL